MNFLKRIFGGGSRPSPPPRPGSVQTQLSAESAAEQRHHLSKTSLCEALRNARFSGLPSGWVAYRKKRLLVEIPYPQLWSLDERGESVVIRPSRSREVLEGGNVIFSPAFSFMAGQAHGQGDDLFLDQYWSLMQSRNIRSFTVKEVEKETINGTRTLAAIYDYQRDFGPCRVLLTLRVKGREFYYLDASGAVSDIESARPELVRVLANFRVYASNADFDALLRMSDGKEQVSPAVQGNKKAAPTPVPRQATRQDFLVNDSDRGKRVDVYLTEQLPQLGRSRIQQLFRGGRAGLVPARELKPGYRLKGGERLWVELPPGPSIADLKATMPASSPSPAGDEARPKERIAKVPSPARGGRHRSVD